MKYNLWINEKKIQQIKHNNLGLLSRKEKKKKIKQPLLPSPSSKFTLFLTLLESTAMRHNFSKYTIGIALERPPAVRRYGEGRILEGFLGF